MDSLMMIIPLAVLIAAIWVYVDATDHTDMGCVWGILAFVLPIPIVPLYFIMRLYSARPASKQQLSRFADERKLFSGPRFASDIEKLQYLEWAEKGPGTMFDPLTGLNIRPEGYRHFTDARAEQLITQARYADAWDYLIELYGVAHKDQDVRGLDTYKNYISRLPDGLQRLQQWQATQEDQPPPPVTKSRDVPF